MAIEKVIKLPKIRTSSNPFQGSSLLKFYAAFFLGTFILSIWHYGIPFHLLSPVNLELNNPPSTIAKATWRWSDAKPSQDLIWHSCYDTFQCARLSLPLDWLNTSNPSKITLAIIRLPATNLTDYRGPVFTNPGGPGGSGIYSLRENGHNLQKIVGRNHDIISFDPRGVGASTPLINCWASKQTSQVWKLGDVGLVDSHPGVLYDAYARASALSHACQENMHREAEARGEESLLRFVSTTSVARDMLEIMEKSGTEKMRYWGFSYGTFLGGVFAAMYPDRVERMVSDGNVDYIEWSTNSHASFLHDSDKIMEAFYHYCHASGPKNCAFYSPTPSQITTRLENLLTTLKTHPIIVPPSDSTLLPEIITYTSLKRLISATLYRPMLLFPTLANVLLSLETGDGIPFLNFISTFSLREPFTCECDVCNNGILTPEEEEKEVEGTDDAMAAIMCSDGGIMNETVSEFKVYADTIMKGALMTGAANVEVRMSCVGWNVVPKWRYTGPFTSTPTHPILYIANLADNVTPLRSALSNARNFPNSRILIQNSFGHTSLAAPSICTAKIIRAYFQEGLLPEKGMVCGGRGGCLVGGRDWGGGDEVGTWDGKGEGGKREEEEELDKELKEAGWGLMLTVDFSRSRFF
ncbi:b048dbae-687f-473d-938d-625b6edf97ba [Sclerotinia trifoliorum]|uniref:B048dbae-687f-473d-938d-625b6edf97ba n=1 Tax=Sclerotinia trifoliorum TaxID=28548 RepID=A0A8H2ZMT8_9HELO|nr:b048dbae-687f-473d-938d-625b6edf97ba [Sclerotinia trifoliorum]